MKTQLTQLLDNLTEEYWTNQRTIELNEGWGPCTFFYNDCGKISIKGTPTKEELRREIYCRLKDKGWGLLSSLRQERMCLQDALSRPFNGIVHQFNTSEISYMIEGSLPCS